MPPPACDCWQSPGLRAFDKPVPHLLRGSLTESFQCSYPSRAIVLRGSITVFFHCGWSVTFLLSNHKIHLRYHTHSSNTDRTHKWPSESRKWTIATSKSIRRHTHNKQVQVQMSGSTHGAFSQAPWGKIYGRSLGSEKQKTEGKKKPWVHLKCPFGALKLGKYGYGRRYVDLASPA